MPYAETSTHDIHPWLGATMSGVRDAILRSNILNTGLPGGRSMPSQKEVDTVVVLALEAVTTGRAIDFGHLPNAVIKDCGNHGGQLFNYGALHQPFHAPWLFVHTWDGARLDPHDTRPALSAYLVNPRQDDGLEIVELQPAFIMSDRVLVIGDRAMLYPPDGKPLTPTKYHAEIVPFAYRFDPGMGPELNNGATAERAAAGNVLDPLMAALLLLNTVGLDRTTVTPSDKVNKARAKNGKPPIPSHEVVDSRPYVTALTMRKAGPRPVPGGGHHASPIPHIRRAHFRTYESGDRSFIRETLVRFTEEARSTFVAKRSHYEVRP